MAELLRAVEQRKDFLKSELMRYGYFKTPEGKQLYELPLADLEALHIKIKSEFGKNLSSDE